MIIVVFVVWAGLAFVSTRAAVRRDARRLDWITVALAGWPILSLIAFGLIAAGIDR